MKYYLLKPDRLISGPFELETIEAQWEAGRISPDTRATADNGESLSQIRNTPAEDWMPVQAIPGFGQERAPESVPDADADAMRYCPDCAYKLPKPLRLGETDVCERCGRTLGFAPPPPPPPVPPIELLPKHEHKSSWAASGCLTAIGTGLFSILVFVVVAIVAAMAILSLLANLLFSNCRA